MRFVPDGHGCAGMTYTRDDVLVHHRLPGSRTLVLLIFYSLKDDISGLIQTCVLPFDLGPPRT